MSNLPQCGSFYFKATYQTGARSENKFYATACVAAAALSFSHI